jgi:hypothetical protein
MTDNSNMREPAARVAKLEQQGTKPMQATKVVLGHIARLIELVAPEMVR